MLILHGEGGEVGVRIAILPQGFSSRTDMANLPSRVSDPPELGYRGYRTIFVQPARTGAGDDQSIRVAMPIGLEASCAAVA